MIYLDNAASTPMFPEVIEEIKKLMSEVYGNPSSIHSFGRQAKVILEESRKKIAELLHTAPSEIVFTSGGTEANNMALWGCVRTYNIKHIITSGIEHPAVLKPIQAIGENHKIKVTYLDVDRQGQIDIHQLEEKLQQNDEPTFVSLMYANNETGSLLPLEEVSEICKGNNIFFHSDMVQTIGKLAVNFEKTKVGFASSSAHKYHGPKGIGFLYINENNKISPILLGGSQERNMRAGTENVWAIAGMVKALEIANKDLEETQKYITGLKDYMVSKLKDFEGVTFNADSDKMGLHTILSVSFPLTPQTEMLIYNLDIAGVAVSGGSACASGSIHQSHVLEALHVDANSQSLRVSFSKFNTKEEIDKVIAIIKGIIKHEV